MVVISLSRNAYNDGEGSADVVLYDPPGGWRYGFPRPYKPLPGETLEQTLLRDGYPQREIDNSGAKHCRFIGDGARDVASGLDAVVVGQDAEARIAVEGDTSRDHAMPANDNEPYRGQIYLDMDGVLADFDAGARAALNTDNSYKWEWIHGTKAFWDTLYANDNFFFELPPMPDAFDLFDAVAHLRPVVLTALPKTGAVEVDRQKRAWIARHLGGDVPVITCQTSEKPDYCLKGDVLVDDRSVNRDKWQGRGGHYVLHTTAADSIRQMRNLGVI